LAANATRGRARRNSITAATLVASLTAAAGAWAGGGGVEPGGLPEVKDVRCISDCAGVRKAAPGSRVELQGRRLSGTTEVSFDERGGGRIEVEALTAEGRKVKARVPDGAATGKPQAIDGSGDRYRSPEKLTIVDPDDIPDDGGFELRSVEANPRSAYVYGSRDPVATYKFGGGSGSDVVIEVVDLRNDDVVRTIVERDLEPFVEHRTRWNGKRNNGKDAPKGRYRFRVGSRTGGSSESSNEARFELHDHIFPLRARHSYGDGLGAGRGHQGQDVFAKCGSPLVAARAGRVQWKQYHSAAGYYLVIDGKGTGRDYVYMHMKKKGRPNEGKYVKTGERIGQVSDTGNASGCHLHFELWSAPGWYEGGHATDPTDDLKRWDRYS
jgi:Peptidase family M23